MDSDKIKIRAASREDIGRFWRYVIETFQHGMDHSLFTAERLGRDNEFFVAEQDGSVIGAVTMSFDAETGPTLDVLYVIPPARRSKVGCQLCEAAIKRFLERQATPIYCLCKSTGMVELIKRLPPELRPLVNAVSDTADWDLPELQDPEDFHL